MSCRYKRNTSIDVRYYDGLMAADTNGTVGKVRRKADSGGATWNWLGKLDYVTSVILLRPHSCMAGAS